MKSQLFQTLLESPLLLELLNEGRIVLAREQELRRKFHSDITPDDKWVRDF